MFYKSNPNQIFLYTCIHVYLHTCFLPNKPNFIPSYPSVPSMAKNMILQNKPNFTIFDLKTRVSAQNKPKFQFLYPGIPESLYSCFLPNKPNFPPDMTCCFPLHKAVQSLSCLW